MEGNCSSSRSMIETKSVVEREPERTGSNRNRAESEPGRSAKTKDGGSWIESELRSAETKDGSDLSSEACVRARATKQREQERTGSNRNWIESERAEVLRSKTEERACVREREIRG